MRGWERDELETFCQQGEVIDIRGRNWQYSANRQRERLLRRGSGERN